MLSLKVSCRLEILKLSSQTGRDHYYVFTQFHFPPAHAGRQHLLVSPHPLHVDGTTWPSTGQWSVVEVKHITFRPGPYTAPCNFPTFSLSLPTAGEGVKPSEMMEDDDGQQQGCSRELLKQKYPHQILCRCEISPN